MKFSEFIMMENVAQTFKNFEKWIDTVQKLGATNLVLSVNHCKKIAVSNLNKPIIEKYGEWDEKNQEGWVFNFHKSIQHTELNIDSSIPLKEKEEIEDKIPYEKNIEIRKLIKKGAMSPEYHWINALDLVHRAYEMANVERPTPSMRDAWAQYEENLLYAVQMLQRASEKGIRDYSWKMQQLT